MKSLRILLLILIIFALNVGITYFVLSSVLSAKTKISLTPPDLVLIFQDELLSLEPRVCDYVIDYIRLEAGDRIKASFILVNRDENNYCIFKMYDPDGSKVAEILAQRDCGFAFIAAQEGDYKLVYILHSVSGSMDVILDMIRYPIIPVWSK